MCVPRQSCSCTVCGTPHGVGQSIPEEKVKGYFSRLQEESFRVYLDMLMLNLPSPKWVNTPLLVLGAEDDGLILPGEIESTARAYGTRSDIIPNMANDMMLEVGWCRVADRILGWLNEQGL